MVGFIVTNEGGQRVPFVSFLRSGSNVTVTSNDYGYAEVPLGFGEVFIPGRNFYAPSRSYVLAGLKGQDEVSVVLRSQPVSDAELVYVTSTGYGPMPYTAMEGYLYDTSGTPVERTKIVLAESTLGATTDEKGAFRITLPHETNVYRLSIPSEPVRRYYQLDIGKGSVKQPKIRTSIKPPPPEPID